MPTISIRVDETLKQQMDRHPEINWSAEIRQHIDSVLGEKKEREVAKAVLVSERLSQSVDADALENHDSTALIRDWREKRYGPDSQKPHE